MITSILTNSIFLGAIFAGLWTVGLLVFDSYKSSKRNKEYWEQYDNQIQTWKQESLRDYYKHDNK